MLASKSVVPHSSLFFVVNQRDKIVLHANKHYSFPFSLLQVCSVLHPLIRFPQGSQCHYLHFLECPNVQTWSSARPNPNTLVFPPSHSSYQGNYTALWKTGLYCFDHGTEDCRRMLASDFVPHDIAFRLKREVGDAVSRLHRRMSGLSKEHRIMNMRRTCCMRNAANVWTHALQLHRCVNAKSKWILYKFLKHVLFWF